MIQLAAAFHLAVEGGSRMRGAAQNFSDALDKLRRYPARYAGLDLEALRARVERCEAAALAVARGERAEFSADLFFELHPDPA